MMGDRAKPDVDKTPEGIANYIIARAQQEWDERRYPLLLSRISPELTLQGVNYKEVLPTGLTLRQFVSTLDKNVRIVVHPTQRAKIGIVPNDSTFVFEAEPSVAPVNPERSKKPRQLSQRYVVMQFLAALSRLSDEDQKSVNIPTHILARLMEKK